ncbi:mediator complex protein [Plectosphaerella plurivora]|uniref:Mediator of RNA polymerase II transcription subunit 11 n=1 Tax=Plectosphaerella plurivora TaxID=936078 RepID=A0A9P9A730_9PEZI|nr:mediator complex protein [Plectosphaerella plurivora]
MADEDKPMGNTTDQPETIQPFEPFTLEERISQLCEIDKNIVLLMSHTAQALGALGPQPASVTQPSQLQTFKSSMDGLLETLHDVDVHMKRQILGLEEAGIIRLSQRANPDAPAGGASASSSQRTGALTASQSGPGAQPRAEVAAVRASLEPNGVGSIGALDVGWLNSRNSKVERDMEAELWAGMKHSLEDYEKAQRDGSKKPDAQGS